ncbi:MAG: fibro-slime domain-containing protein [Oscillospiraceae bacterium]|nr:fibro-slime domain-containing protein [Oscillospiraceae bacterium]
MKNIVNTYVEGFRAEHQKTRRAAALLLTLALIVAAGVFWQLHFTGIALTNETYCGLTEHEHSEDCYEDVLVCELEEGEGHTHDESCYETQRTLVCTLEESEGHTHDDGCYDEDGELICDLEESEGHTHDDSCYEEETVLVCGLEESEGHTHTADCYESQLVCGLEEHTHSADCMSSETADVETAGDWKDTLPELTGVWADDVVAIAQSQLGYTESTSNFILDEDGVTRKGYTRYGAWAENEYGDWDAMFASFCLYYAEVSTDDFPESTGAYAWSVKLQECELYADAAEYTPIAGDIVFFDTDEDEDSRADRVGIVTEINEDDGELTVIEGDCAGEDADTVAENTYSIDDSTIIGYGILPEQKIDAAAAAAAEITEKYTLSYENDDYAVTVTYDDSAELPENVELAVSEYDKDSETYQTRYAEAAELYGWGEEAYDFRLFDICLIADGEEIEPAAAVQVTISFLEKDSLTEYNVTHYDETAEAIEAVSEYEDGTQSVTFGAEGFSEYSLSAEANVSFTVQYYAWLDIVSTTGEYSLTVIDTSAAGNDGTAKLPQNGTTPATTTIGLKSTGEADSLGTYYTVATESMLTEVYSKSSYTYLTSPGLDYFDKLKDNSGYSIDEIWVLKSGKSSTSTNESDWDVYDSSKVQGFTNNSSEATDSVICISEGTVIRLVYTTVSSDYTNKANLYDYDISDGNTYSEARTSSSPTTNDGTNMVWAYTEESGINSASNYSGTGTKLGFGNNNTRTGLASLKWNGALLNMSNKNTNGSTAEGYSGCTFGLVSSLSNGKIKYADGVVAPNLFDEGTAIGKTTYSNQDLTFNRVGDTYTLTSVSGDANVSGLDEFVDLATINTAFFTNNFWPMDTVGSYGSDHHDLKFGSYSLRNLRKTFGTTTSNGTFPYSDDYKDHNSYFGMQYAVEFTLPADYVGPLNYYFFGDDDMWVFLDDQLVCDIGGVHSSVGEYVDLWDYIKQGEEDTHTLSFFYTERGASGSSCYMRFTLPSVTSATTVQDTGTLRVEKEVSGTSADANEQFEFTLNLKNSSGSVLTDLYGYSIYNSNGSHYATGSIKSGDTFFLSNGQYIIVNYLPDRTVCTVTEANSDYTTTYTVDSGSTETGTSASATISNGATATIHFVNTRDYALPSTGGSGTWMFTAAGIALCALTGGVYVTRRRRHE